MRLRLSSGRPYTASRTSSGAACVSLYQRSHSARSWMRKSAERSITRAPASRVERASPMATPFGVAKKTTSQPASARAPGSVKARSTLRRRLGNMRATGVPASLREVIAFSSTCGCWTSRRSSSTPVYPVPPTIPAFIVIESKKPPVGGFQIAESLSSAFRVLLAPPCLVQADLLSLDLARVARHQPGRAQRRLQGCIILDQRARDAVAHGAGLAALAAAVDVHQDVERRLVLGELEGLAHHHAAGLAAEELVHRLAVDHEVALAGLEEHAGHGALAPPCAVVIVTDHGSAFLLTGSPMLWAAAPNAGASRPRKP